MRFSLGFVLALSLAGLQFLAILTVVFTSFLSSERAMLDHARELLSEVGANTNQHVVGFLKPALETAGLTSRVIETGIVSDTATQLLEKYLFQSLQNEPSLAGVFYGDADGNFLFVSRSDGPGPFRTKIIYGAAEDRTVELIWRNADFTQASRAFDPSDTFDPRSRPWYKTAASRQDTIWTDPYIFFTSQKPGITVAAPVRANDQIQGVVGVDIELSTISEFLSGLAISDRGSAMILNANGDVIAHPDFDQIIVQEDDPGQTRLAGIEEIRDPIARTAFSTLSNRGNSNTKSEAVFEFVYQDERYVSLIRPIVQDNLPWTIAIYASERGFIQDITENRRLNFWFAAIISLVAALVGLALTELILKPVRAFAVRTALVSQGEMSAADPLPSTYKELQNANETLIDEIAQRRDADAKILDLNRDLSHFSRVNLMGQMATGLAHELSQPLTAISQNVDAALTTAKQQDPTNRELLDILSELDEQAHRGGDVLRALRGFVRKDLGDMRPFDFEELLDQTHRLMKNELDAHDIVLKTDTQDCATVFGNRTQIAQILVNLIRNATDAIAEANSSIREISVKTVLGETTLDVIVQDTGPGVGPDVRLFKQFETRKNDGMGLGLSISRKIAENNGGRLWFDQDCSTRSRFCLSLMLAKDAQPNEDARPEHQNMRS